MRPTLLLVLNLMLAACAAPSGPFPAAPPPGRQAAFPPGPPPPPMSETSTGTGSTSAPLLVGPVWAWEETLMSDDTRIVADAPDRYTLQFQPDGRVIVRADCNRGSGTYALNDNRLSFGPIALTRKHCPPGSRDAAFLKGVINVSSHLFAGPALVLELQYDSGTMRFRVLPQR
jgi:heat shock protein HslJ